MTGLNFLSFADESAPGSSWRSLPRRAARALAMSPPVRGHLQARYERYFATEQKANLFRGVYDRFDDAAKDAPPSKPLGYDNPGPAAMYRNILGRLELSDYPILFWLARTMRGGGRLFDLGGHVGLRYYAFRSRLVLPDGFVWEIMDVPAVVKAGRELAIEQGATALRFTERREDMAAADILYASGSLQYFEAPLHELLAHVEKKPPHVLVNQTPMHDGPAYYTLQSIGTAFCPYRIEDRHGLTAGMEALGYERIDTWKCPEKSCPIPFHPERSIRHYDGAYFRARAGSRS